MSSADGSNIVDIFRDEPEDREVIMREIEEWYVFDPDKFDQTLSREMAIVHRFNESEGFDERTSAIRLELTWQRWNAFRDWCEKYDGKIPRNWGENSMGRTFLDVRKDVEDDEFPWSDELIDAAIDYPELLIPMQLGYDRILSDDQLERVLDRLKVFDPDIIEEVRISQEELRLGINE